MARVDPDDDEVRRFVVQHYRYDPERHQRRRVTVEAFDNEAECDAARRELQSEIDRRRNAGETVDPSECATSTAYAPGDRRRTAFGRIVMRAFERGADVRPLLEQGQLPRNVAFLTIVEDEAHSE